MKFMLIENNARIASRIFFAIIALATSCILSAQTPTNIQVGTAVQQATVNRLGVNLGDQSYWDSGQLLKNLVFRNPGFEGLKYRSILKCSAVTANTCMDDNQYSGEPTGFWSGGTYMILSGNSAGKTGTVVLSTKNTSGCSGCGQYITFDQNINAAVGDYFVVTNYFPGSGDAGWWDTTSGGGTITTELTDLSPETVGKQALVLTASGSGQLAGVASYFDSFTGLSFIQMNGTFQVTFRAKALGGNNKLYVNVQRSGTGGAPYLSQTVTLTNTWQDYTLNFTANETGTSVGTVGLVLQATGSTVELDDVGLQQTNSSSSNPTVFRDDVVNALKELNPGSIRMMAAGAALGSDLINQIQLPYARYREGFNSSATTENDVAYGIHEFLQLCQTVGADPWITIPTATTPAEMTAFIQYLTGTGSDQYSALRIARGQTAPWNTVFNKIHLELGNETWNGDFKGESMGYPAYPQWANQVFGAARATNGFVASQFDLVLDGWSSDPGYTQIELEYSTQHDSVDIAPYLLYSLNNESQALQFGAMFAEPEMWELPGGIVYNNMSYAQKAAKPANLNVYEVNLGSIIGSPTEAQLTATQPSVGAGIAHADHMLQMMRLGVKYQNAFSLPQYEFQRGDGSMVHLWGLVIDMGTTNRRRPQFLTQALANSVIGGTMLQTVQTGANPTWNQPLSSDKVQLANAHEIQSFAFSNNGNNSVILFNLSQTAALGVTLSGVNAPSGSVQMSQITSANITDNNETSDVVQTATQTLSGFNPATGLSLPPFSMTVLTSSAGVVQAPSFSVAAGSYTSAQNVTITDATASTAIYYTTDGSTPTTSSNAYTGPITVSTSETLNAIAVVSGQTPSAMTSAAYVISQPVAATPVFSVAGGTYTTVQTVSIADTTAGAAVYYTTDGSVPTAASNVYSAPITVSANETLNAIATATGYTQSAQASASYVINLAATAPPAFSVGSGSYTATQNVIVSDTTPGAVIYYTTNGSVPTTGSSVYSGPISVSSSETLSAMALATGYTQSAVTSAAYVISQPAAAAPIFSVSGGSYTSTQNVIVADTTPGAVIYYTTNGSVPTTGSSVYSGPISVSSSETLSAMALATGYTQSAVTSAAYVISQPAAAAPIFSVSGGSYTSTQNVIVADTTPGAVIYYTTNGSVPTTGSSVYSGPISVSSSETLSAIAIATGYTQSAVTSAAYVISQPAAAAPIFSVGSGSYTSTQNVIVADTTPGAVIYYTTNGSVPTTGSSVYSGPISVSSSETLSAIAIATGYTQSAVTSAAYVISQPAAAAPIFSVGSGSYTSTQNVIVADTTPGAVIYYTTNGSVPMTGSSVYSGPISVSSSETLSAIAIATGYTQSAVTSAAYVISQPAAAAPIFSVGSGSYTSTQNVIVADTTPGAAIYYTTNGSVPTTGSSVYSGPISVSSSETLSAIAIATGYKQSAVTSATYMISQPAAAAPIFSVGSGSYTSAQNVIVADTTPGAVIYYTTNGSVPTTGSSVYSGPISVSSSETLSAIAIATGYTQSAVTSATYVIAKPTTATPTFSLGSATYTAAQTVSLTDATAGATIYFTTNGATPTTASTKYAGAITISSTETLKAIAVATNYNVSGVASATYTIEPITPAAAPVFSIKPGSYTAPQTVELTDETAGAVIYYTTTGSIPTASSAKYTGPITIGSSVTVKAIAIAAKHSPSEISIASFSISVLPVTAVPVFSVKPGTYFADQNVVLTDATAGAQIMISVNGGKAVAYTVPLKITKSTTITAMATAAKHANSLEVTAVYLIKVAPAAAAPVFSIKPGTYTTGQTVELTDATEGAQILVSVNGSATAKYSEPIKVTKTTTIKAIASATGHTNSNEVIGVYSIVPEPVAATPVFTVKPGTYTEAQTVELKDATAGAEIMVSLNGAAATKYAGPIKVTKTTTIKAMASAAKYLNSSEVVGVFTINVASQLPETATPVFTVKPGTYTTTQTVALKDATAGAEIMVSVNGSTALKYTTPIEVTKTTTIKAIATAAKHTNSAALVGVFTIEATPETATPVFTVKPGTYTTAQKVAIEDATPGAVIMVSLNGAAATKYAGPIEVSKTTTIKATATAAKYTNSAALVGVFTIDATPETATPVFTVKPGTYTTAQKVAIEDATPGAVIMVSLNGAAATKYAGPIEVSKTTTIKATATAAKYTNSAALIGVFTIEATPETATPVFTVKPGTYTTAQKVAIEDATPGAVIMVSLNGAAATKYAGPIEVSKTTSIKATATAAKYTNSAALVGVFTIDATPQAPETATPVFSVKPGTYTEVQTVALKDATAGAEIVVSINGLPGKPYTGPIKVTKTTTIKAIATAAKHTNSASIFGVFTIDITPTEPATAAPTFSVKSGTYDTAQKVVISDSMAGATIVVSVNGSAPVQYTGPIEVKKNSTIKAVAAAADHTLSTMVEAVYVIKSAPTAATPTFSLKPGTYDGTQTVSLKDATAGAAIMMSVNGGSAIKYTVPVKVTKTTTIKAIAVRDDYTNSAPLAGTFTIK